ncbi:MAG: hypothetical protein DPW16_10705 [Chloroflexi bacterium]|nr:hypothetical protein [Chloroflexota bacterium]
MLEKLDSIDWAKIHHSHGTAEQFPQWIRELTSDDPEIRQSAFELIREYSHHQDTNYQVTPYVVPFIVELAQNEGLQNRHQMIDLIGDYAYSTWWILDNQERIQYYQQLPSSNRNRELFEEALTQDTQVYEEVVKGLPVVVQAVTSDVATVRLSAYEALLNYRVNEVTEILPALLAAISNEVDPHNQLIMVSHSYRFLDTDKFLTPEQKRSFVEPLQKFTSPEYPLKTRYAAALRLAMILQKTTSPEIIHLLEVGAIDSNSERFYRRYDPVCRALAGVECDQAVVVLTRFLLSPPSVDDAHRIAITLLDLVFYRKYREIVFTREAERFPDAIVWSDLPDGYLKNTDDDSPMQFSLPWLDNKYSKGRLYQKAETLLDVNSLTDEQRCALQTVVETDAVWLLRSNLLELYGLPAERSMVRALLEG